ncbi:MAG: type II secretion system F family protein [Candidatus Omnitrophota bacterium]
MATFKYTAKDANAKTVTGKIIADNQAAVIEELRKRKLVIISIKESKESTLSGMSFGGKRVKPDDIVIFSRQLSTMVDAGIPLLQGLDALQEQMSQPAFKTIIAAVRDDIEIGSSLSASMAKHPQVFDTLFVSMVKAGETGGALNVILDRVAGYMEKSLKLQRKVKSAMVYPSVVITMAFAITLALLIKVVPTFKAIFESLGGTLPGPTQLLINVSDALREKFLWVVGVVILSIIGFNLFRRTEFGRLLTDRLKLRLPVFGDLLRKVAVSRFCRTLSTLTQSGVPILSALDIVGKTCGNRVLEMAVTNVKNNVREGETIAAPLVKSGVFPPMVTRMIAVGEQTGEMEKMLGKVADFYDDQVDAAVSGLTSMIEPLIIGFLGIIVGGIVIALFLPIIKMSTMIGVK